MPDVVAWLPAMLTLVGLGGGYVTVVANLELKHGRRLLAGHGLEEVTRIATRATVLRNGRLVQLLERDEFSHDELVRAIMGEAAAAVLDDRRDLVQKAAGWMLREVGKRVDRAVLLDFLEAHAAAMGRTALSYATEHVDPEVRARLRAL